MKHLTKNLGYEIIYPGTAGIAQRISLGYKEKEAVGDFKEVTKLVFLMKNNVMVCGQNQY